MNRQRGMTLVELLVCMVVLLVVVSGAATAYLKLLRGYRTQSKIAQSYMSNLVGLELLRFDIEMAGYGIPSTLNAGTTYSEAAAGIAPCPVLGATTCPYQAAQGETITTPYYPSSLNGGTSSSISAPPRPVLSLDNQGRGGSDVLSIRSAMASINNVSKKWSIITQDATTSAIKLKAWGGTALDANMDFTAGDKFLVLDGTGALVTPVSGSWSCYTFSGDAPNAGYYSDATAIASGINPQSVYLAYGLDPDTGSHRMPFNRVDYFLERVAGQIPSSCAPSTYTLYRSPVDQNDGHGKPTALMDCVRDFQVAFGLDTNADGNIDTWTKNLNVTGTTTPMTAATIRTQLREVRVFILFHEGTGDMSRDPSFRFSGTLNLGDQDIAHALDSGYSVPPNSFQTLSSTALSGNPQLKSFTPTGTDTKYRWKVIELAVKPMNLK